MGLPPPRRSSTPSTSRAARRCATSHEVILEALPGIDVGVWDYGGKLIGYGAYDYSNSKGPAGRWFSVGIANRKSYISLYAMGNEPTVGYLRREPVPDRFRHQDRPELHQHQQA